MLRFPVRNRRTLVSLAIAVLLAVVACVVWMLGNRLAASQLSIIDAVRVGDVKAVEYIAEWDRSQLSLSLTVPRQELTGGNCELPGEDAEDVARGELSCGLLEYSICRKQHDIVRILLSQRAWYKPTSTGTTPLSLAAWTGDEKVVALLLSAGHSPGEIDSLGMSPLSWACIPRQCYYPEYAVRPKTEDARLDVIGLLIAAGASPDGTNAITTSPLWFASPEQAEVLLQAGANAKRGYLHNLWSAPKAALLIRFGADVDERNELGETPLHCVDNPELARVLIQNRAELEARDQSKRTPLHCAREPSVVAVLVEAGADVAAIDGFGNTPLHCACTYPANAATIGALLIAGADPTCRNKQGDTPLHVLARGAKYRTGVDALRLLLAEMDALTINATNAEEATAADLVPSPTFNRQFLKLLSAAGCHRTTIMKQTTPPQRQGL